MAISPKANGYCDHWAQFQLFFGCIIFISVLRINSSWYRKITWMNLRKLKAWCIDLKYLFQLTFCQVLGKEIHLWWKTEHQDMSTLVPERTSLSKVLTMQQIPCTYWLVPRQEEPTWRDEYSLRKLLFDRAANKESETRYINNLRTIISTPLYHLCPSSPGSRSIFIVIFQLVRFSTLF